MSGSAETERVVPEARGVQDTTPAALSAGADVVGILDSIDIPIVGIGLDCRVTRFNPAAAEILGIRPSDIGRRTCNLQALAELPDIWHMCVQVMADGVPSRHDLRNGDRWFLLRISPCKEPDGRVRGAVLTFTNVTAFRASVGQAVYEREYTKTILNTVIDPLVVLGPGLRVQTGNRAFYDWFGASREQTQGVALSDLGDGDWKASGLWPSLEETLSHDREFRTVELEASFPSKGLRTVLLDARRLARDGTALVLLAFRDITERKTLDHLRELLLAREEALRKDAQAAASALAQTREALRKRVAELAAADRHKNEFLAILAHELRNPLAPLRNAVQILHRFPGDAVVTAKARDLIDRQVHHMSRLVSDLLEAARAQHGQIKLQTSSLDLRSSIEHVVDLIRPPFDAKHQTLRVTLPEAPVWVQGDATRLEQVFTNLLSNANKYTGERGAVEISLESCLSDASTRWAVVRVVDNGQGIDADLVPRLFQLFTQADRSLAHSQGGLGIGLSLVRTLVELHGGRVSVRSGGRDRGSTFEVRIPMRPAPLGGETSAPALASVEPVARRRRVLVVEDNQDIRESSCELLEMAGFEVMGVSTGPEALEQAPVFGPHVLLLDVGLPGLSGYDVARRLRAMPQFASTLLVAITGYDTPEARERSAVAGFDHHICKPVNFDELARLLN